MFENNLDWDLFSDPKEPLAQPLLLHVVTTWSCNVHYLSSMSDHGGALRDGHRSAQEVLAARSNGFKLAGHLKFLPD